jgi:CBS domain-containing protein
MNTGAIGYRVADFLKQHPPFQGMEEADLVALAKRGRVKFHEADEFLCWQGTAFSPYVFVIQQGTVSLWEEANGQERLRDILGVGDLVGVDRFGTAERYPYSAKSVSEVVVYALDAAELGGMIGKYPQAARYVAAQAVNGTLQPLEQKASPGQWFVVDILGQQAPLTCSPCTSIQEAAHILHNAGANALAVVDCKELVGIVSAEDLLGWLAQGGGDLASPVGGIARGEPCALATDTRVSQCVAHMLERDVRAVALVGDGALHRVLHTRDLTPAFGEHPVELIRQAMRADGTAALRVLHGRARAFIAEHLIDTSALEWLAGFSHEFNSAVLRRLIQLAGASDEDSCWCFYGAGGRRELLTAATPNIAISCRNSDKTPSAVECLERAQRGLQECGYLSQPSGFPASFAVAGQDEWLERFAAWVQNPVMTKTQQHLSFFDLRPVSGSAQMWQELDMRVRTAVRDEAPFLEILANDCLANLPPLTFFHDLVVDELGQQTGIFRLENNALRPLVDVARVFGFATGCALGSGTLERLEGTRTLLPEREAIFRSAATTARAVLFHQARIGIRAGHDGNELPPSLLSRRDQKELKNGFRSIFQLLEFASSHQWTQIP